MAKTLSKNARSYISVISATLLVLVIGALGFFIFSPSSGDVADKVMGYEQVEIPKNSRDLKVTEPPKNAKDNGQYSGTDMQGKKVSDVQVNDAAQQVANIDKRFKVPSVGLDVPLGAMNEVNGVITPTNYTSAFTVRNRGVNYWQTHKGTAYIVVHALDEGGIAPGNFLVDSKTKKATVTNGDLIQVGTRSFSVEKTMRVGKEELKHNGEVWKNTPGRLLVILCIPGSNDNLVVVAQPS